MVYVFLLTHCAVSFCLIKKSPMVYVYVYVFKIMMHIHVYVFYLFTSFLCTFA